MIKSFIKKIIPTNDYTTGLVFECNSYGSFALINYKKKRGYKIYFPHEVLTKEYNEMFLLPTKDKIKLLNSLAGTETFKIRGDLFEILFCELLPEENKNLLQVEMF